MSCFEKDIWYRLKFDHLLKLTAFNNSNVNKKLCCGEFTKNHQITKLKPSPKLPYMWQYTIAIPGCGVVIILTIFEVETACKQMFSCY